jgi:hypothetical protein
MWIYALRHASSSYVWFVYLYTDYYTKHLQYVSMNRLDMVDAPDEPAHFGKLLFGRTELRGSNTERKNAFELSKENERRRCRA